MKDSPIKILINGARGRMGNALIGCAGRDPGLTVEAALDIGDDLGGFLPKCQVAIDFTHATTTASVAAACAGCGIPLVIGTTGQSDDDLAKIRTAAETLPIVMAPNFSVGVNALFWLTAEAARILGPGFDLEVVEMHHRLKKDAPSGTAKRLCEVLAEVRGWDADSVLCHGRSGMPGERPASEIGMHSLRGGDVVGDHTVVFAGDGERVELTHKASSRDTFATGALRAAKWLIGRPPGLYDMQDVLGLRSANR